MSDDTQASPAEGHRRSFRRPALLDPGSMDGFAFGELDPAVVTEVAHETAAVIVRTGRATGDPELTARLVDLVEEVGLSTLAQLWSQRPARSLPGALWRLYTLREWVRRAPLEASADYAAGEPFAAVAGVVAGVGSPPGPSEVRQLADEILRGVFEGDLAVALHRAAAFCRVVSAGRAARSDAVPADPASSQTQARRAAAVLTMGEDLDAAAKLWQRDALD